MRKHEKDDIDIIAKFNIHRGAFSTLYTKPVFFK